MTRSASWRLLAAVFLAVTFIIGVPQKSRTQGNQIGTVDLSSILIFHPEMAFYDHYNMTFRKPAPIRSKAEVLRRSKEAEEKILPLANQKKILEGRLEELRRNYHKQSSEAQAQYEAKMLELATGPAAVEKNRYLAKTSGISQKYTGELRAIQAQIDQTDALIEQLKGEDPSGITTSKMETEQKMRNIFSEVKDMIQRVATAKGIGIVLETGPSELSWNSQSNLSCDLPNENPYAWILSNPVDQKLAKDPPALQGAYSTQGSQASAWLKNRTYILSPFKQFMFSSKVIMGGIDLTGDVLVALLSQYRVDKTIQWVIINSIRTAR